MQWLGAGTSALFAGERGTGKTIAAHALASALGRELFRVDLGSIVSKFIGETEKNLNALLAEAEQTGAVLLLDEADALFGPRTNVADAHDRFSDDERRRVLRDACCAFEAHSGVVILESRSAADTAWHAHMAQVVRFPLALAWGDG